MNPYYAAASFASTWMSAYSAVNEAKIRRAQIQAQASSQRERIMLELGYANAATAIEGSASGFSSAGNVSLLSSVSKGNAERDKAVITLQANIASAQAMAQGYSKAAGSWLNFGVQMAGQIKNSVPSDGGDSLAQTSRFQTNPNAGRFMPSFNAGAQPHARGAALGPAGSGANVFGRQFNSHLRNNGWLR